jgi:hypothetical protein
LEWLVSQGQPGKPDSPSKPMPSALSLARVLRFVLLFGICAVYFMFFG